MKNMLKIFIFTCIFVIGLNFVSEANEMEVYVPPTPKVETSDSSEEFIDNDEAQQVITGLVPDLNVKDAMGKTGFENTVYPLFSKVIAWAITIFILGLLIMLPADFFVTFVPFSRPFILKLPLQLPSDEALQISGLQWLGNNNSGGMGGGNMMSTTPIQSGGMSGNNGAPNNKVLALIKAKLVGGVFSLFVLVFIFLGPGMYLLERLGNWLLGLF